MSRIEEQFVQNLHQNDTLAPPQVSSSSCQPSSSDDQQASASSYQPSSSDNQQASASSYQPSSSDDQQESDSSSQTSASDAQPLLERCLSEFSRREIKNKQ